MARGAMHIRLADKVDYQLSFLQNANESIRNASARTVTQTFCGRFGEDWNLQRLITEGVK